MKEDEYSLGRPRDRDNGELCSSAEGEGAGVPKIGRWWVQSFTNLEIGEFLGC